MNKIAIFLSFIIITNANAQKAATLEFDGIDVAAQGNFTVDGNIVGDADENKTIFEQTETPSNTITC